MQLSEKCRLLNSNIRIFENLYVLGGPVTFFEKNDERHVLIGTIHGAFANCDYSMPGIYVRVDDSSNLQFLHKEALNSGTSIHVLKETCRNSQTMI